MMLKFFLAPLLACALVSIAKCDEEIIPVKKFSGQITDASPMALRPPNGVIGDRLSLQNLWAAWRPDEETPRVDFDTQIVLVETAPGPNTVLAGDLMLDGNGHLTFAVASTRKGGGGFGYLLMVIPKSGIQSVNGHEINLQPPKPVITESIKIDMTGKIETGIVSIGGETTGTVISSNGIVWELDFQDNPQLAQSARVLNSRTVNVKGTLTRVPGTEIKYRWIVNVDSLSPPATRRPQQVAADQRPRLPSPGVLPPQKTPDPIDISKIKKSFQTIVVETTGGPSNERQTLTIKADGTVVNGTKAQGFSTSWTIPPNRLEKLHQFIEQTDWRQIPRSTLSGTADAFKYEISIEKPTGLTRLVIDSPSLSEQPTLNLLFRFFRRK